MKLNTPKEITTVSTAKSGRYYASTAKKTEKAREAYRAIQASLGKSVLKIH